jgi:hypothetical protein
MLGLWGRIGEHAQVSDIRSEIQKRAAGSNQSVTTCRQADLVSTQVAGAAARAFVMSQSQKPLQMVWGPLQIFARAVRVVACTALLVSVCVSVQIQQLHRRCRRGGGLQDSGKPIADQGSANDPKDVQGRTAWIVLRSRQARGRTHGPRGLAAEPRPRTV